MKILVSPVRFRLVPLNTCMAITRKDLQAAGFITDGCSYSPDFDFCHCCVMHDYLYWRGRKRSEADALLKKCIIKQGKEDGDPIGHFVLAEIYWLAVRTFGWIFWKKHQVQKAKLQTLHRIGKADKVM